MSWLVRMELDKEALRHCPFYDSYAWHQALWKCFPDMPDAKRDFLSRLEWQANGCRIFMLCRTAPVRPAWCPQQMWGCRQIASDFLEHDRYIFDIIANPTRKIVLRDAEGQRLRNGRREAILNQDQRRQWLLNKAAQHGFMVDEDFPLLIENAAAQSFSRQHKAGTLIGAHFRGCLHVTDRQLFKDMYYNGIGSAKAFGYGMMLLKALQ